MHLVTRCLGDMLNAGARAQLQDKGFSVVLIVIIQILFQTLMNCILVTIRRLSLISSMLLGPLRKVTTSSDVFSTLIQTPLRSNNVILSCLEYSARPLPLAGMHEMNAP